MNISRFSPLKGLHMKKIIALMMAIIVTGCYPVSHIVVGDVRPPVSPEQVKVDYIRSYLPEHELGGRKHGEIAYSYLVD